jgi:gamma-glutamyltranspeptidase/glutathione hydrolase
VSFELNRFVLTVTLAMALPLFASELSARGAAAGTQRKRALPARAPHAMVASVHPEASRTGVAILKAGGNAVDAAVAVGFALAVVHPQAGNLGGGGFLLLRMADGSEHFLDFREKAPAAATANMFLNPQGDPIPHASWIGYTAIGVPGSVAGMTYAQQKWGRLPLSQLIAPAVKLAREGFVLSRQDARELRDPDLAKFADSHRIFQRNGHYYRPGEIFRQPELARTLERIAADPEAFYRGAMAKELAAAIQKGGGLVRQEDLAAYQVKERPPVHGTYRGYEILGAPPPSSGGVALIEVLNILEGFPLSRYGSSSAQAIHLVTEAFRRAFFDRAEFLADPDFARVPVAQLIDSRYGSAWREGLNPGRASRSADLRRPAVFHQLETYAALHPVSAVGREPENTTHFSVADAEGNAAAVTTTLNDTFGSRVTAGSLGFLLNNEMDDFSAKPGSPNAYGLIQSPANSIAPHKRPLSSMSPTIVLRPASPEVPGSRKKELFLVLGSPGGPRIISAVANILIGVIDYGLDIQQAVDAPRFHHQWMPDKLVFERGFPPATVKRLRGMGHGIQMAGRWSDGECIMIDPQTGDRLGASDRRRNGKALGY